MLKALSAEADMQNRGIAFCKVTASTYQQILCIIFLNEYIRIPLKA